ncbi:hypothetical protein C900_05393 [Fulvivirga imtechensis AK7]|uniref:Uncharacterized protein n=1 Tax=Fulvivirga imtechensis AK7 TaxID=1237149 RepID=L8JP86_9BACT|nr:hypothetical protein [Fulvivirga imtechensis]ELR69197.1 hypothetical protein C900_05393 [Fulvivirga imtechensis AK7]
MDVFPLEEIKRVVNEQLEDVEYREKRARSPKMKRALKHSVKFWKSVKHHLNNPNRNIDYVNLDGDPLLM